MSFEFIQHQATDTAALSPTSYKRVLRKSRQASALTRQKAGIKVVNQLQLPQHLLSSSRVPRPLSQRETLRVDTTHTTTLLWRGRLLDVKEYASSVHTSGSCSYLKLASECIAARLACPRGQTSQGDNMLLLAESRYLLAVQSLSTALRNAANLNSGMWQAALLLTLFEVLARLLLRHFDSC
jgi:hypothetical protein